MNSLIRSDHWLTIILLLLIVTCIKPVVIVMIVIAHLKRNTFSMIFKTSLFAIFQAWRVRSAILNCFYDCFSFFSLPSTFIAITKRKKCNRISTTPLIKYEKIYITVRYSFSLINTKYCTKKKKCRKYSIVIRFGFFTTHHNYNCRVW